MDANAEKPPGVERSTSAARHSSTFDINNMKNPTIEHEYEFRREIFVMVYNDWRPHKSLQMSTPSEVHTRAA